MIKMGTIDIGKYPDEVKDIFGDVNGTPSIKEPIKWQLFGKIIKKITYLFDLFYIVIRLLYRTEQTAVFSAALKITMAQ